MQKLKINLTKEVKYLYGYKYNTSNKKVEKKTSKQKYTFVV